MELFANSGDPDQKPRSASSDLSLHCMPIASEEANWSGSALFAIMWVYSNNPDQVIWLAEN